MDDQLSVTQILLLFTYAIAMAGTPPLFKLAAVRSPVGGSLGERFLALIMTFLSQRWRFMPHSRCFGSGF